MGATSRENDQGNSGTVEHCRLSRENGDCSDFGERAGVFCHVTWVILFDISGASLLLSSQVSK